MLHKSQWIHELFHANIIPMTCLACLSRLLSLICVELGWPIYSLIICYNDQQYFHIGGVCQDWLFNLLLWHTVTWNCSCYCQLKIDYRTKMYDIYKHNYTYVRRTVIIKVIKWLFFVVIYYLSWRDVISLLETPKNVVLRVCTKCDWRYTYMICKGGCRTCYAVA